MADATVVAEVEAGARAELSRAGALRAGSEFPRLVVEVLRIDGASEGIAARAGAPVARGTKLGVLARAWIERMPGGPHERDTTDLRSTDTASVEADPRLESLREEDALRASARRLGERLARKALGQPEAPDDGM